MQIKLYRDQNRKKLFLVEEFIGKVITLSSELVHF